MHSSYPFLLMLVACGTPDVSTHYGTIADVIGAALEDSEAAVSAGADVASRVTTAPEEVPVVDLAKMTHDTRCRIRFTLAKSGLLGAERWGYLPSPTYDCHDSAAGERAKERAWRWLESRTMARVDRPDLVLQAHDKVYANAPTRAELLTEANAWSASFDLSACIEDRVQRYAGRAREAADARCAVFEAPGYRLDQLRGEIEDAAKRARERVENTPIRQSRRIDVDTAAACGQAVPAETALAVPGDTDAVAAGAALAFGVQVFAGEMLTVYLASPDMDPVLALQDGSCEQTLAINDDWRGRTSRVQYRARETMDVVVVARVHRGVPEGEFALTVETEGADVLTEAEKQDLEAFASWAAGLDEAGVASAWRAQASPDYQAACLEASLIDDAAAARGRSAEAAIDDCLAAMQHAVAIRKEVLSSQSLAGSLLGGLKKVLQ